MHDTDRGANATATRLAALAALRHSQGVDRGETDTQDGEPNPRRQAGERSEPQAGVYAAVETAVRRSRIEFLSRLLDYRRKIDCEAFEAEGSESLGKSLDDAQFVAHRIAGVGKTLGFADLGDHARQAEAAITAYKLESTSDLRQTAISRVCKLVHLIESTCAEHEDCEA